MVTVALRTVIASVVKMIPNDDMAIIVLLYRLRCRRAAQIAATSRRNSRASIEILCLI
jgi:hypothetical protein